MRCSDWKLPKNTQETQMMTYHVLYASSEAIDLGNAYEDAHPHAEADNQV